MWNVVNALFNSLLLSILVVFCINLLKKLTNAEKGWAVVIVFIGITIANIVLGVLAFLLVGGMLTNAMRPY